jgi:RNA polymerase sigma-70 factor (ECF subfamily)
MAASPEDQRVDLTLMRAVSTGERAAVARLYDRFGSLVYRMAYQILPTRDEAEDAVQEVFIRLWRTAARYDPQRAALVTWVMLITRRYLVDRLRRARAAGRNAPLEDAQFDLAGREPTTAASLQRAERFGALMRKIDRLPAMQRTVVIRAYLQGQTLRQIGEELNTPLGTIKSALSRALVRLRENEELGEEVHS